MAMKVNELMIGDWIEDGYKQAQVTSITCDGIVETTAAISNIEVVDPIPLTEEILTKNGFERCDYNNQYFIIDDAINLIIPKWRCGTEYYACAWYQDEFDDLVQHIEICKCAYVHQLQHLLRLCDIDKEIELCTN